MLALTPGNLITHLRKPEEAGYFATSKTGSGPTSRTSVALTYDGRRPRYLRHDAVRAAKRRVSGPQASGSRPMAKVLAEPHPARGVCGYRDRPA